MQEYYDNNQTFHIAIEDKENKQLLSWLMIQRILYKKQKLSDERIEKLKGIGYSFELKYSGRKKTRSEKKEKTKTVDTWDRHYLKLINYKFAKGDSNVPKNYSDKTFAQWISRQRYLYRKGGLTQEQINKLNLVNFEWSGLKKKSEKEIWLRSYEKLKNFFNERGNSSPKKSYGDKQLVSWVLQQRHRRRKGKLMQEFIDLLDQIKFDWNPQLHGEGSKPDNESWLKRLEELIAYKNKFGDTNVSQLNKQYYSLARWVNDQRVIFKKKKLSQERIDKLNAIGFIWELKDAKSEQIFNERFNELIAFHKIYKNYKVPQNCKEFPKLGGWVSQIRHRGTTPERKKRLDEIGFNWKMIKKKYDKVDF